eukprot:scaffold5282_cov132-Isochrysis_galbana.AAC.4
MALRLSIQNLRLMVRLSSERPSELALPLTRATTGWARGMLRLDLMGMPGQSQGVRRAKQSTHDTRQAQREQ